MSIFEWFLNELSSDILTNISNNILIGNLGDLSSNTWTAIITDILNDISWHEILWHNHFMILHFMTFHGMTFQDMILHDITVHEIIFQDMIFCDMTFHDMTVYYMTFQDMTFQDLTTTYPIQSQVSTRKIQWINN